MAQPVCVKWLKSAKMKYCYMKGMREKEFKQIGVYLVFSRLVWFFNNEKSFLFARLNCLTFEYFDERKN